MNYLVSIIVHACIISLFLFFNPFFLRNLNKFSSVGFMTLVKSQRNQTNNMVNKAQNLKNGSKKAHTIIKMNFSDSINKSNLNAHALRKGSFVPPIYPNVAIDKKHEGVVTLVILLDKSHKVKNILLQKTSGYSELDETALVNAKKNWVGKKIENSHSKKTIINVKFSLIK